MAKFRIIRKSVIAEKDRKIENLESQVKILTEELRKHRFSLSLCNQSVKNLSKELGKWKPVRGKDGKFVKKSLTTQTN